MSKITNKIKSRHNPLYVTVYTIVRSYGGPEEGGWWYNLVIPIDYKTVTNIVKAHNAVKKFKKQYPDVGDIYSTSDGEWFDIHIEKKMGEHGQTNRPRYC
jgi:hypothetical protein